MADAIKDMGFVRPDGKTLIAQPHLSFEEKDMWTLDHVRGYTIKSPLLTLREMTPEQRAIHIDEYRKGFTIKPV
jgi:propane monooxygenase large subunit